MKWAIGLDVGGTKIAGALVSDTGEIRGYDTRPIPARGEPAIEAVLQMAKHFTGVARDQGCKLEGIGIAVPGAVDTKGIVLCAPNLEWENIPLKNLGEKSLGLTVEVELDVRAAALGVMLSDMGRDVRDFIYVTIGTGIGAGIVVGGELYRGYNSSSGEIGHCVLVEDGPSLSGCTQLRGCLEALASGPAIAKRARRIVAETSVPSKLSETIDGDGNISCKSVFETALAGDYLAGEVLRRTAEYMGRGFSVLINILNPQKIIVGGGVVKGGGDFFLGLIRQYTAQYTFHRAPKQTEIVLSNDIDRLPITGAANLIFKRKKTVD